jgi:hypothetical protein
MKTGCNSFARKSARYAAFAAGFALLSSPVLVPALAAKFQPSSIKDNWMERFTPAGVDSRLAEKMQRNAVGAQIRFPFTPAVAARKRDETITVAARTINPGNANAISVRSAIADIEAGHGGAVRLNNSGYRLTAARGWQGFNAPVISAVNVEKPQLAQMPGAGGFTLDSSDKKKPSRFNTEMSVARVGQSANPRGNAAAGDYSLNVGGSFSISRRIDLTAGVRYASERDRLDPVADKRTDSEAVYVGTKIRF